MITIWKFDLEPIMNLTRTIEMPKGAELLHIGKDPLNHFCIWAVVDTEKEKEERTFYTVGTGWDLDNYCEMVGAIDLAYLQTIRDDDLMWHIFEEGNIKEKWNI